MSPLIPSFTCLILCSYESPPSGSDKIRWPKIIKTKPLYGRRNLYCIHFAKNIYFKKIRYRCQFLLLTEITLPVFRESPKRQLQTPIPHTPNFNVGHLSHTDSGFGHFAEIILPVARPFSQHWTLGRGVHDAPHINSLWQWSRRRRTKQSPLQLAKFFPSTVWMRFALRGYRCQKYAIQILFGGCLLSTNLKADFVRALIDFFLGPGLHSSQHWIGGVGGSWQDVPCLKNWS